MLKKSFKVGARLRLMNQLVALALSLAINAMAAPADFTVQAPVNGKTFRLSEARGKYVALHFLLKTECPICLRHTRAYAEKAATMPDVVHVFLKPDSAEEIKGWSAKVSPDDASAKVPIYRDPDAKLAGEFNIPGGYQFHGEVVHYPALVLLDKQGKEVFRYVGKNNSDRFSYEQFSAKLKELSGKSAETKHYNLDEAKLALQGYDPVGYFTQGKALKGSKDITTRHEGVTYQFASKANQKLFIEAPEKYLPTYGGWCATAMAQGEKVEIDPTNFKVTDGRLFLFFKAFYANALKDWNKAEAKLTVQADANWEKISRQ